VGFEKEMKPTRNIVKPNTGMWTTKGKVWYQKNDDYYDIKRFYREGKRPRIIEKHVTLEQAQAHCKDPKTRKEGVYFDGYDKE